MKKYGVLIISAIFFLTGVGFYWKAQQTPATEDLSSLSSSSPLDRVPSSDNIAEVDTLNRMIFTIKDKTQVDPAIKQIIEYAKQHPESEAAQIYSVFAQPIYLFKGIAWRLRMLVEPIDAAYIGSISWLRAIKRNSDRRSPHIDALFDYFVDPNPDENIAGQKGQFVSLAQFQDYMAKNVNSTVLKQLSALEEILKKNSNENNPLFMFDSALVFGADVGPNMTSQTVRYRKVMPGHIQAIIANMYERMGFGLYLASYNMEKLARFLNTLTTQSLIAKKSDFQRGILSNVFDIHLQSPKEISAVLARNEFADFMTLRKQSAEYLPKSLTYLRHAINVRIKAFREMEKLSKMPNQREYFVNPDFIVSRPAVTLAALQKRMKLLYANNAELFTDRVDSKNSFNVNIAALFNPNNPKIKDLKKLYPRTSDFKADPEKYGSDPKTFKWNYEYGTAQNWPDPTFGGLLPGTSTPAQYREKLISISRDASTPALQAWLRLFM